MVKTSGGVLDINPVLGMDQLQDISREKKKSIAERKKELEELEKRKKQEIDELDAKKKREIEDLETRKRKELEDLEKKKKELEELEKKKAKEIADTEELIEQSFQDLMRHKRILIKEEEDLIQEKRKKESKGIEYIAKSAPKPAHPEEIPKGNYTKFFEELHAPRTVYEATNYNFYQGLAHLRDRAARGEISAEEEAFVDKVREQFEKMGKDAYARDHDNNQYIQRSLTIIDQIWQYKVKTDKGY